MSTFAGQNTPQFSYFSPAVVPVVSLHDDHGPAKVSAVSSAEICRQQRRPQFHAARTCPGVPPLRRPHTKSHAIPLSPAPTRAHKRRKLKDLLTQSDGLAGELHAELPSPRLETATRTARSVRSGTAKPAAPARTIMPQVLGDLDARCYKRRQIGAFSTAQYGVLLQTSSNQAQNTQFLAK